MLYVHVESSFNPFSPLGRITWLFRLTLENGVKMEATSTRRAGLERFTFPKKSKRYFMPLDLTNDLPGPFAGSAMNIDPQKGRITLGRLGGSRYELARYQYPNVILSVLPLVLIRLASDTGYLHATILPMIVIRP